jgi:hypothetical protein
MSDIYYDVFNMKASPVVEQWGALKRLLIDELSKATPAQEHTIVQEFSLRYGMRKATVVQWAKDYADIIQKSRSSFMKGQPLIRCDDCGNIRPANEDVCGKCIEMAKSRDAVEKREEIVKQMDHWMSLRAEAIAKLQIAKENEDDKTIESLERQIRKWDIQLRDLQDELDKLNGHVHEDRV